MPLLAQIPDPLTVLVSAIVGGAAAALINLASEAIKRSSESKRKFREMAFQFALENWKHSKLLQMEIRKQNPSYDVAIPDPAYYISHMLRIVEIVSDMNLSSKDAADRIAKIHHHQRAGQ